MNSSATAFSNMPNDDAVLIGASDTPVPKSFDGAPVFREPCRKCGGSGKYRGPSSLGSACFGCKGRGFNEYKAAPEQRAHRTAQAQARKNVRLAQEIENWSAVYAAEAAWIEANKDSFDFARAMAADLKKYGCLTPNKTAAIARCIEKSKARVEAKAVEKAALEVRTEEVKATKLEEAFAKAKASGLKWPKITLTHFTFKPAGESSKNAGSIYVTRSRKDGGDGAYLGKVMNGRFTPTRDCAIEQQAEMAEVLADPEAAARAYGNMTGNCAICSRELTAKDSVGRGIGPICAAKYGWGV